MFLLGILQEKLAEKVSTSTHYIGQIEQKNKFPSPEMMERIAAALEIDTPQLFSMASYTDEAIRRFMEGVTNDLEAALTEIIAHTVEAKVAELKK